MAAFAEVSDLEARWRTLSATERSRATVLLDDASAIIRTEAKGIDARIDSGDLDAGVPKAIVCAMVKAAMSNDLEGVTQQSETKGPFTESFTFANPSGDLYLTKAQKRLLGISQQRAGSIYMLVTADDFDSSSSSSSSSSS